MPKVFFCYRREDSTHQAGRIYDQFALQFPRRDLFKDVNNMPIGLDFRRVLSEKVAQCDVLLALIGDSWLVVADANGRRRLDDPSDFVRIEIESARYRGVPIVPVLVGRELMPNERELPETLRELAFRHGLPVRPDPDFHRDVDTLVRGIRNLHNGHTATAPVTNKDTRTRLLMPVGRSSYAIAAGYLGLFSPLLLPAPFAVVFGVLAVRDMQLHPEKHGMGRAVFGICIGAVMTLFLLVVMMLAMFSK